MFITCLYLQFLLQLVVFLQCIQLSNIKYFRLTTVENKTFLERRLDFYSNDPIYGSDYDANRLLPVAKKLVEMTGIEPATP